MENAAFTYGSLLNSIEHKNLKLKYDFVIKAQLQGYRRVFNKLPSWRTGVGSNIAVLNIEQNERATINGLLLVGLDDSSMKLLDKRERGYERILLSANKLNIDVNSPSSTDIYKLSIAQYCIHSYIAKAKNVIKSDGNISDEREKIKLEPNMDYLKICLEGASEYGDDFYKDFISSTYLANGIRLDDYLAKNLNKRIYLYHQQI